MERDPVCGMMVEPAKAAGTRRHAGRTLYFDSEECLSRFDADPHRYGHPDEESEGHSDHTDHERDSHQGEDVHAQHDHPAAVAEDGSMDEHTTHTDHAGHEGMEHGAEMDHSGHQGMDHDGHVDHTGHEIMFRNRFWVSLVLTVPVLSYSEVVQRWFGFTAPTFPGSEWITPVFSVIIFLYGGVPFLQMARPEFSTRRPAMMALISLAISVAFVYSLATTLFSLGGGFYWELVTLIDIMLLGHWLEMRSVRQASGALDELAKLMPDTAERVASDGSTAVVPTGQLRVGDVVLVRPGGSIPADGEIVEGESDIDEAMITGESRPVEKRRGHQVIGGTILGAGSLRVRVTATGEATALAGIMRLVEQAQRSKSRTQLLADRAAGWLFYIAVGFAALTAAAWIIAVGFDVEVVKRVTTVLVIACPHALGLAIPLVVAITTSTGARNGILVRDRLALEAARDIDVVVFDKTGTLTRGQQGVVDMVVTEGWDEAQALALAAAAEGDSEHLIARAIRHGAHERGVKLPRVTDFEAIKGRGIRANVDGQTVHVGGPRMMEMLELKAEGELATFALQAGQRGHTVVYLAQDGQIAGAIALADVVRPESRGAVLRLQKMGMEVAMLTGDSADVARTVAEELGIDRYFAEVLPEHKDEKVAALQAEGKRVAMVGDGINDAPALTRADIGIAIGSGTDVAIESAGIILVKSNPMDVVKMIALSRASYGKMVQNLIYAAGYNVVALPLAAGILAPIGILLSPAVGALFMSLSTVAVAINAQLLRRVQLTRSASELAAPA